MCPCASTLKDCIDIIYALTIPSSLGEIFSEFGEKMSHYEISDFETVESLTMNFLKHSGKGCASSTTTSVITEIL